MTNYTMFNITATSSGPSALTLSWNALPVADHVYVVRCTTTNSSNYTESVCTENYHTLSLCVDSNATSVTVDQLFPATNYTCCVLADGNILDCKDVVLDGGLSTPIVGVIGGFAGIVVGALIVLLIAGLIVCCSHCKKHR